MRQVTMAIMGLAALLAAVVAVMIAISRGHEGILIRSTAGGFIADTNVHSDLLQRNYHVIGFRKCDYFTGLKVFTTVEGSSCPWYMSDEKAVSDVRKRAD